MRIEIHGRFLLSGRTVPLAATYRSTVEAWIAKALVQRERAIELVTVVFADALGPEGVVHKRCEIIPLAHDGRKAKFCGAGRTQRKALIAAIGRFMNDADPSENCPRHDTPTCRQHDNNAEVTPSC
jgi:hypothetical protein